MNQPIQNNSRILWPDIVKGIMMLGVIIWHMPNIIPGLKMIIAPFFMPAFFFISGYFHRENKTLWDFTKSKFFSLIIPFIIFGFINAFTYSKNVLHVYDTGFINNIFSIFCQKGIYHDDLWFLPTLFVGHISQYVLLSLCRRRYLLISFFISVIFVCFTIFYDIKTYWHIEVALIMQFYMNLGFFCNTNKVIDKYFNNLYGYFIVLVYVILTLIDGFIGKSHYDVHNCQLGNPLIFLTLSVIGIYSCVFLSKKISRFYVLPFIGKNTLVFYAMQTNAMFIFYCFICGKIERHITTNSLFLFVCLFLFILLFCGIISIFVNKFFPIAAGKYKRISRLS